MRRVAMKLLMQVSRWFEQLSTDRCAYERETVAKRPRIKRRVCTYTSRMRSPLRTPAFSAAPWGKTALTCWRGAYNSPFMLRSCPPSLTCPRTLNPNPVSVLYIVTHRGPWPVEFSELIECWGTRPLLIIVTGVFVTSSILVGERRTSDAQSAILHSDRPLVFSSFSCLQPLPSTLLRLCQACQCQAPSVVICMRMRARNVVQRRFPSQYFATAATPHQNVLLIRLCAQMAWRQSTQMSKPRSNEIPKC